MVKPGLPVMNADGTQVAHGAVAARLVLEDGMKLGYQDVGSATLLKSTRSIAAGSLALQQFIVSKTVSLKKSHVVSLHS